jgi:hypothetical protein
MRKILAFAIVELSKSLPRKPLDPLSLSRHQGRAPRLGWMSKRWSNVTFIQLGAVGARTLGRTPTHFELLRDVADEQFEREHVGGVFQPPIALQSAPRRRASESAIVDTLRFRIRGESGNRAAKYGSAAIAYGPGFP